MRFAKWVFYFAGVSGILVCIPPYFLEAQTGRDNPPPINHPEYYYGFFGVTLAWQVMFLVIATDPVRYRLAMLPAVLEKAGFVIAIPILVALERVNPAWLGFVAMDATLGVLFVVSFLKTPRETPS